jgi:hypothetical protein
VSTPLLPLFPLGTVLLPGAPLPLRIFEDRYRRLVHDLSELPPAQRRFGVVAIREGREVGEDGVRALHDVGCVALCTDIEAAPDGTFSVRTVGTTRFRLLSLDAELPYLRATVERLAEPAGPVAGLASVVMRRYAEYRTALGGVTGTELTYPELPQDPRLLSYLVAATVVAELADRQAFLAELEAAGRLTLEARWLAREVVLMRQLSSVPAAGMVNVSSSLS